MGRRPRSRNRGWDQETLENWRCVWKQGSRPLDDLPLEYVGFVLDLQVRHLLVQLMPDILEVSNCPKGPLEVRRRRWLDRGRPLGWGGTRWNSHSRAHTFLLHQILLPLWSSKPGFHSNFPPTTPSHQVLPLLCLPIMATMIFRKIMEPSNNQRMT